MKSPASVDRNDLWKFTRVPVVALLIAADGVAGVGYSGKRLFNSKISSLLLRFSVRIGNTPQRQATLNRLPANRCGQRVSGRVIHDIHADACNLRLLDIGSRQALDRYGHNQELDAVGRKRVAADVLDDFSGP